MRGFEIERAMGANPTVVTLTLSVWRVGKQHKIGSKNLPAGRTVGRWMTLSFVELQKAQLLGIPIT